MIKRVCENCGKEYVTRKLFVCGQCRKKRKEEIRNLPEKDRPMSPVDRAFRKYAENNGYEVTKCGYPDFICYDGEKIVLVEVKSEHDKVKDSQIRFMKAISKYGVTCLLWRIGYGFIEWPDQ